MATNIFFNQNARNEQSLFEDLIIESLKIYGQDLYYLPRDLVNVDPFLGDDIPSRFNSSYRLEMYIENADGYDGDGDLMTKFGVELRDNVTLIVSRRRWKQTVARHDNEISSVRPREGDLIYVPLSKTMFEIMRVEHEQPFFQINNVPTYKLVCEKFEYSDEQLDTGVVTIDDIETVGYQQILTLADSADTSFLIGAIVRQQLAGGVEVTGEITAYNDSDNLLYVTHIGSNDDGFHLFAEDRVITSLDEDSDVITRMVTSVGETLNQVTAQNEDFADIDFIDFSETNPFGEPS